MVAVDTVTINLPKQYPFYRLKTNVIPCWVVTALDVTSSGTTASRNRLGTGSALYLYDNALGRMSEGFEHTILLGTIQ